MVVFHVFVSHNEDMDLNRRSHGVVLTRPSYTTPLCFRSREFVRRRCIRDLLLWLSPLNLRVELFGLIFKASFSSSFKGRFP